MFRPILQSKNVFIIHKNAMERVATSEEQAGAGQVGQNRRGQVREWQPQRSKQGQAGQTGHLFIIHKDAMQRVASRVERDRAGQPQRDKQGTMAGTGPATVSGAASALLQSSLENSCEL